MTRPNRVAAGDTFVWLPEIAPAGEWVNQAACRDHDPDMWFPPVGNRSTYQAAVAICADCPVRLACLNYAVTNRIRFGVWGGLNEDRRRRLRPPSRPARPVPLHGTPGRYRQGCRCPACREAHRVEAACYREGDR